MADSIIRTESQGPLIISIAVGFVVASGIIVLLRVYARLVLLGLAGPDDWTILAATVRRVLSFEVSYESSTYRR
jgi:hypothetical protein